MEHSQAILSEADRTIDRIAAANTGMPPSNGKRNAKDLSEGDGDGQVNSDSQRSKKKQKYGSDAMRFGSRGGGGRDAKRNKKGGMGRGEYFQSNPDKRKKVDDTRNKNRVKNEDEGEGSIGEEVVSLRDNPVYSTLFPKEEIEAEERRPKRKVAVMIGYSGTGYKGMQLSAKERTIEGDLFLAFVKAGAISKANADDPKKASLVRCARTDKGVHAAGNMISLKLIVEDEDIVDKINEHLSPQIRVWGIERTINSFSCYQACDSRWYEYLIPSHAFLPPHPSSWLAKKCDDYADESGDRDQYESRQQEVRGFWEGVEELEITRIIESLDEDIRFDVVKALQGEEEAQAKTVKADADVRDDSLIKAGSRALKLQGDQGREGEAQSEKTEEAAIIINDAKATKGQKPAPAAETVKEDNSEVPAEMVDSGVMVPEVDDQAKSFAEATEPKPTLTPEEFDRIKRLREATKRLRQGYQAAKRRYRIPKERIARIQDALNRYLGTKNYHNFTVQKTFRDPSAKRNIKSFVANPNPILIGESNDDADKTEWLSLKVHGQSFMMHQIRKMVGMIALLVRCGSNLATLDHALTSSDRFSIPKVPGLGLLLERPVFESYNTIQAPKHDREPLRFEKFDDKIEEFKRREIYARVFREEEERNEFGRFFNHVDNFKEPYFLFVTSKGHAATESSAPKVKGSE